MIRFLKKTYSLAFFAFIICLQQTVAANKNGYFIENKGQLKTNFSFNNKKIDYYFESDAVKIFVTKGELIFQLFKSEPENISNQANPFVDNHKLPSSKFSVFTYEMKLMNINSSIDWEKSQESDWYRNYYSQVCPEGVPYVKGYQKILLRNIYSNIDWEIIINENKLKYNFIVHPGGDPNEIIFNYNYADSIHLENNDLKIFTQLGETIESAPYSYQSSTQKIKSNFMLRGNKVKFYISGYDKSKDLIVDPGVTWSTYFGGSNNEYAKSVKTDNNNNVVMCGYTNSVDGVFNGGFQSNIAGGFDNFIAIYNVAGNLLWSTYFGGEAMDQTLGCDIDNSNKIYLAFHTNSTTGIAFNGFQNSLNSFSNLFLVKFDEAGLREWATYFGSGDEGIEGGVAVDKQDNVYLFGNSGSSGMGTAGTYQPNNQGSINGLLAKFDSTGNRIWCTYFGFATTGIEGVCFDNSDNIYFSGSTTSPSIAFNGFKDTLSGITDAYLAKFDSTGNRIWVTYYGGSDNEGDNHCSSDTNSNVYLYGYTTSPDQISYNGFQNNISSTNGTFDGFVVKFDSTCNRQWSTYFGGPQTEGIFDGAVTIENNLIICGVSRSDSGVAYLGYKNHRENDDGFLAEFSSNGDRLWSSYFGGPVYDEAFTCATDRLGNIYLAGETSSSTGIGINGEKDTISGSSDAFLTQFNCSPSSLNPIIIGESNPEIFNSYNYSIDTSGVLGYYWEVNNGQIISGQEESTVTIFWNQSGNSEITVHSMYSQGCYVSSTLNTIVNTITDPEQNSVQVFPNPFLSQVNVVAQGNYTIRIIDLLGRTLIVEENKRIINTEIFTPGVYFLEIDFHNSDGSEVFKIAKE